MPHDDFISASEIAQYVYCNRAWWLRLMGNQNENQEALSQGSELHTQYSRQVNRVTRLERVGRAILLLGIALLIVFVIVRLFLR
jgi:CRISPR/Cas system-associated exonuclease Cas4 (RecB family)